MLNKKWDKGSCFILMMPLAYLLFVFKVNRCIEIWNVFLGDFDHQVVLACVAHLAEVNNSLGGSLVEAASSSEAPTAASTSTTSTVETTPASSATATTVKPASATSASSKTHLVQAKIVISKKSGDDFNTCFVSKQTARLRDTVIFKSFVQKVIGRFLRLRFSSLQLASFKNF